MTRQAGSSLSECVTVADSSWLWDISLEIMSRDAAFRRAILGEAQTTEPARRKTILSEDRRVLRSMLTVTRAVRPRRFAAGTGSLASPAGSCKDPTMTAWVFSPQRHRTVTVLGKGEHVSVTE